jgi:sRNA-binding protein
MSDKKNETEEQKRERETKEAEEKRAAAEKQRQDEEAKKASATAPMRFVVAKGHSVSTAGGLIDEGQEITLDRFPGSNEQKDPNHPDHRKVRQAALDRLIEKGVVVRRG